MEPLPGWLARRRQDLPPAREVVERLPLGPALDMTADARRRA